MVSSPSANSMMFPKTYSDGTFPSYGKHDLASPYVMLNNTGYTQDETQRNMLTLKLEQEFGGFLKGMTASVQAMSENINYFNEGRYIWPDLYRATEEVHKGYSSKHCVLPKRT